jgi:hypothetical protein
MRRVLLIPIVIGTIAAIATPAALVISSQHRELESGRQQRKEFCLREANFAFSNASVFEATKDPKSREQLALNMFQRHQPGSILAFCAPGLTVDAAKEDACWLEKGDPNCFAPYLTRLVAALELWRK